MTGRMKTWRKLARVALSAALAVAVLCFGMGVARADSATAGHAKSHAVKKANAKAKRASVNKAAYKIPTHKRRYRRRRHHVTLPKQPSVDRTQEIQAALERRGYYSGEPTGKWDSSTQESLRRFQTANGLPPTGKLDALSLQKMGLGSDVAGVSSPRPVTAGNSAVASTPAPKTPGR